MDNKNPSKIQSVRVVIVTHNAEQWLPFCLGSLRKSKHPVSVVVVDNASSDRTVQVIREQYPEVQLIPSSRNLGFGNANNLAFQNIGAVDAVYLLNQDACIYPDTIDRLTQTLDLHPDFGVVSPVHLKRDGIELDASFRSFLEGNRLESARAGNDRFVEVSFVNAAHWLIRKTCLDELGGFAPIFFHYGEDVNFTQRARHTGWRIGIDMDAKAIHAREGRPGSAERDLLELYGSFLVYACRPDRPAWQSIPGAWRRLIYNLFAMEVRPPRAFARSLPHAVADLPAILQTRRQLRADTTLPAASSVLVASSP